MSNSLLYVVVALVAVAVTLALAARGVRRAPAPVPPEVTPVEVPLTPFAGVDEAAGAIRSLQPDDAVVACQLEGLDHLRVTDGPDAVEALQLQLARHLGDRLLDDELVARVEDETFLVVLRDVRESADRLVRRIIETWAVEHPARRLYAGAALHRDRSSPLDTAESARAALFAAQRH